MSRKKSRRRKDGKSNRTRQRNKTGNRKVESKDSPEIPDRSVTSDIRGLPCSGFQMEIIVG